MPSSDMNRQMVNDAYACFRNGDIDGFFKSFDDDSLMVEAPSLPYGGTYRGMQASKDALITIAGAWTDISYEIAEIIAGDQHVVAYGTFSATGRETGRSVKFPLAEVWRIENGKVLSLTPLYFDTAAAAAALA